MKKDIEKTYIRNPSPESLREAKPSRTKIVPGAVYVGKVARLKGKQVALSLREAILSHGKSLFPER